MSSMASQSAASRASKLRTPYPRLSLQGGHHIAGCNKSPGHLPGPEGGDACQTFNHYACHYKDLPIRTIIIHLQTLLKGLLSDWLPIGDESRPKTVYNPIKHRKRTLT